MQQFTLYASILEVHDGDTLYGYVDHGCGIWNHGHAAHGMGLRFLGCNARELSQPGGPEAQANLAALIPVGTYLQITAEDWDKYDNRLDVSIILPGVGDLVQYLIENQWAAAWNGNGPRPVPPWPRTVTP
jgi:endonuclease YncB( thermonuclease family)